MRVRFTRNTFIKGIAYSAGDTADIPDNEWPNVRNKAEQIQDVQTRDPVVETRDPTIAIGDEVEKIRFGRGRPRKNQ